MSVSPFGPPRAHKATRPHLRTALQILLVALGLVAFVAGLVTVLGGTDAMPGDSRATPNVESELRFYSAFWTGFGVLALYAARRPERETNLLRGLSLFLFLGGLARIPAWIASDQPDTQFLVLMGLELTLPLFIVWAQSRVVDQSEKAGKQPAVDGKDLGFGALERLLSMDSSVASGRRYWIKSNYHRADDERWWHRGWISDWRRGSYEVGDLIVLYLSAREGGPACCPAVVEVKSPSRHDPEWVRSHRDADAAERWPFVTETEVVGEVPLESGAQLAVIGKNGQSVQGGYCGIDRSEFERLVQAMLGGSDRRR
jgi:hypothetical protein